MLSTMLLTALTLLGLLIFAGVAPLLVRSVCWMGSKLQNFHSQHRLLILIFSTLILGWVLTFLWAKCSPNPANDTITWVYFALSIVPAALELGLLSESLSIIYDRVDKRLSNFLLLKKPNEIGTKHETPKNVFDSVKYEKE